MRKRVEVVANVVVIIVAGFVLLRPSGPVVSQVSKLMESRAQRGTVAEHWKRLVDGGARLGNPIGSVKIVEFGDYQCPYCRRVHEELVAALSERPEAALIYRHLPLRNVHDRAEEAALAAICAERQGQFVTLHSYLFETESWRRESDWKAIAKDAGVADPSALSRCMDSAAARARLDADMKLAETLDITGTPAFVHEEGIHKGVLAASRLRQMLAR